ncbi:hypothetical protein V6N12_043125 [Hibiscus sabdariffa]|uniref:Uncharacterized protein n=1 Tax=Hibiscus sabdariffa TaxID=183260 RepID=A0ABR2DJW4_9ROSI
MELTSEGRAIEIAEEIKALAPKFFEQNLVLLFQFKYVEFLKMVGLSDHSGALTVACSHLELLDVHNPNEETLVIGLPLNVLTTPSQVVLWKIVGQILVTRKISPQSKVISKGRTNLENLVEKFPNMIFIVPIDVFKIITIENAAKVVDGLATKILFLCDPSQEDRRKIVAVKVDVNCINCDGEIGCMVNGAELAMVTKDIINFYKIFVVVRHEKKGEEIDNKENMTDEMLAEFKEALSTDMDLVHLLGISTSAYSIGLGSNHDILNAFVSESESDKRFFVFGGCVKLFDDDSFTNLSKPIPFRAENDFKQLVILEMRQNHCFQHWANLGFDDKQKKAFCTHVAKLNSSYYWGLTSYTKIEKELLARLKIGKKSYVDFTISIPGVKVLFCGYDKFIEYEKFSVKEAKKAVFVLDASGLDEQLSYNRTKTIFPTDTTTCFLQLWIEVILTLERSNSRLTQDELAYECITASTVRIRDFGILCTYQRMKLYSFWPGMKSRIKNIMLNDEVCQKTHMSNLLREELQRTQHIMQLLEHPFLPSQEIMEEELVSLIHEHKLDMRENVHQWAVAIKILQFELQQIRNIMEAQTDRNMKNEGQRESNQRDNDKEKKS